MTNQDKSYPSSTTPPRNPEFAVHILNEAGKNKAALIRDSFDVLLNRMNEICMPSRELSVAKTKLEEACFFAKKAMAINLNYQQE